MSENRTFFKSVKEGTMSLGDIFADVTRHHTPQETAQVLTAGTALTTPAEASMLAGWQKPFLFARFFLGYAAFLVLAYLMGSALEYVGGYYLLLVGIPFLVPVTLLLLVWEMNVPRNISLYEVINMAAIGGVLSLAAAIIGNYYSDSYLAIWAGLIEEPAKLAVICLFLRRKNYKYALNGALIGMAVGTGFAILESLIYVINYVGEGFFFALYQSSKDGLILSEVIDGFYYVWFSGIASGLQVAIARAVTAISGHGVFAALYGSALVKAKGDEELHLGHLFRVDFLAYFAIAVLLHALHNYGLDLGLPSLLDGLLPSEYIIIAAVALGLLVHALHIGVNQVVSIVLTHNNGSVTEAVYGPRTASAKNTEPAAPEKTVGTPEPILYDRDIKLKCIGGPHTGEKYRCKEGQSFTIGRERGKNAIAVYNCEYVGGVHCRIEVIKGRVYVTDMTSRNGTYLDGQRLTPNQPMPALNGSVIQLANEDCLFRVHIQ